MVAFLRLRKPALCLHPFPSLLDRVAEFYEEQVEASVKALTSILEPVMIIVIGSIVGFIVISMYLPLFEVYNHIE